MQRIFLSFHYDEPGRQLADSVRDLIMSHGIQVQTGERLAGENLSDEIVSRIDKCDGLVCLLTERPEDLNSNWVRDERAVAFARGKKIASLVQEGVGDGGIFQGREIRRYNHMNPVPALLWLSDTVGRWRQLAGRNLVLQVEPEEAARFLMAQREFARIEYRCWNNSDATDWRRDAKLKPVGDAVQLHIQGIHDKDEVELKIQNAEQTWESGAVMPIFKIPVSRR